MILEINATNFIGKLEVISNELMKTVKDSLDKIDEMILRAESINYNVFTHQFGSHANPVSHHAEFEKIREEVAIHITCSVNAEKIFMPHFFLKITHRFSTVIGFSVGGKVLGLLLVLSKYIIDHGLADSIVGFNLEDEPFFQNMDRSIFEWF